MKLYIRKVREAKGMTLSELAEKACISRSYLSELENNKKKNISLATLCKIKHALDCQITTDLFSCDE